MDRPFEMADAVALQDVAVVGDQDEISLRHLFEADVAPLQPEAPPERVTHGEMTEGHIIMAFEVEDAMGPGQVAEVRR